MKKELHPFLLAMDSYHDVVQRVLWLKSKLSNNPLPETPKIIRLLEKLSKLPVNVEVLQETRIGKCVNGLKKKCPEVAVYVKPLINSWKSLVRTAMIEEERQADDGVQANGEVSDTNEEEASPPSTPQASPNVDAEESDDHRTSRAFTYSPPAGQENEGSRSSQERHSKPPKLQQTPPTPVPWSPERKIFPPFVPKKEREKGSEKDSLATKDSSREKREKERGKSKSHTKSSSSSFSSKSVETVDGHSPPVQKMKGDHPERAEGKSKVLSKEAVDRKAHSLQTSQKTKPVTSNVLMNDKLSSGVKRTVRESKDKSRSKHQSQISHSKDLKRASAKPSTFDDPTLLFQPDVHDPEKSSGQKVKRTSSSGEQLKRKAHVVEEEDDEGQEEADFHLSEKVHKKRLEHKKQAISSKTEVDRKPDKRVSPKLANSSGSEKLSKSSTSKGKVKPSTKTKSPEPQDSSRLSDVSGDLEERTYENTGMSFEDCLFGGPAIIKKKKVSSPSGSKQSIQKQRPAKHDGKASSNKRSDGEKNKVERSSRDHATRDKVGKDRPDEKSKKRKSNNDSSPYRNSEKQSKENKIEMREASASEVDLSLPEIRPDYKPAPRLPEIKPADRKKSPESTSATQWLGSKQTKTKVYSGKARKRHWNSVPSLQNICKEVIFDNIEALYDTGGVPFYLMEDILEKCTPQQLLKIEDYNPDYILESDHLWKKHAERTFKGAERDEMESWRELYLRKNDEREYKLLAITANISAQMAKKDTGRLTKLAFVDKPVKPPRNVIRQQIRHGTSSSSTPAKAPRPRKEIPGEESSHRVIPDREPSSPVKRQRTAKVVAPMMQKSLKMMKRVTSRR